MKVIVTNLRKGENVRHKARAEWGVGKIVSVDTSGTIRVIFEGNNQELSIAQGARYLKRVL
jgi:hypothetical protein